MVSAVAPSLPIWLLAGGSSRRPAPQRCPPLPPFDQSDSQGDVHTVLPPEQVIPTGYELDFWRGDLGGVTLTDTPPFVPGANTTPLEMIMSYFLPYYERKWQDKMLTANAIRNYSHFHLDRPNAIKAGLSDTQFVDLLAYVASWGFYPSFWAMGTTMPSRTWAEMQPWAEPLIRDLQRRGLSHKTPFVIGEELNSYVVYGPAGLDDIAAKIRSLAPEMPVWMHFTSNYPGCYGANFTNEVEWWRFLASLGVKGMLWQANPYDTAGAMGAHLWDSRKYLAAADPNLKVVAFELRATQELYGQCDEAHGRLTGWEMLCATRGPDQPGAPAVAGFGNGATYPDGRWI